MRTIIIAVALLMLAQVGFASSTIYGTSGLIETPDDTVVTPNTLSPRVHYIEKYNSSDAHLTSYSVSGASQLVPNLEVSTSTVDSNSASVSSQLIINAKYVLVPERTMSPSITVGVVDIGNSLDDFNNSIDGMSAFVVAGKNITGTAEQVTGLKTVPVKGTIGFGTGIYKGVFGGINAYLARDLNLKVEYLSNGIRQEGTTSAGLEWQPIDNLTLKGGTFAFKGWYAGLSFEIAR